MPQLKVKINKPFPGYKTGSKVIVDTDKSGVPKLKLWRDRFKDRKADNCIEILEEEQPTKKKVEKPPKPIKPSSKEGEK